MTIDWTEPDIQALKAQEAKDLAIEFLHQLQAKEKAPITPGQVQLKELQFELRLKEAEAEDNRLREAHEAKVKALELEIEREKARQAELLTNADRLREQHANLIEQLRESQESLSFQLERATREHNVRLESLEAEYQGRRSKIEDELSRLEGQKADLQQTIVDLTDLSEVASDVAELQQEIESRRDHQQREIAQLDEAIEETQFEKNRKINQVKRDQEVELAELEAEHRKQVTMRNLEAAHKILEAAQMLGVSKDEWDALKSQAQRQREKDESALNEARHEGASELKRAYNITSDQLIDVTELYYREKTLAAELKLARQQVDKLEAEVSRMRQHIEQEPERISKAVQAAKVQVENRIEQSRNR